MHACLRTRSERGGHSSLRACLFCEFAVAQVLSKVSPHSSRSMVKSYTVYRVRARTRKGSARIYVGSTCALDIRSYFQTLPERPCWLRACNPKDLSPTLVRTSGNTSRTHRKSTRARGLTDAWAESRTHGRTEENFCGRALLLLFFA